MSLTFLHLFLHKHWLGMELYLRQDVNDWKSGRRRVNRSENWPPPFRQSYRQYFYYCGAELSRQRKSNCWNVPLWYLHEIFSSFTPPPASHLKHKLIVPAATPSGHRHQLVSASIFYFIFTWSISELLSLAVFFFLLEYQTAFDVSKCVSFM